MAEHAKAISSIDPNVEEDKFDIGHYQVDSFKGTNMKRVPLEELDFTIYNSNANLVDFLRPKKDCPYGSKQCIYATNMASLMTAK